MGNAHAPVHREPAPTCAPPPKRRIILTRRSMRAESRRAKDATRHAEALAIAQELDAACEIVRRHAREIRDRARSMPHASGLLHAVELSMLGQAEALRKMANAKDPTRLPLVTLGQGTSRVDITA